MVAAFGVVLVRNREVTKKASGVGRLTEQASRSSGVTQGLVDSMICPGWVGGGFEKATTLNDTRRNACCDAVDTLANARPDLLQV